VRLDDLVADPRLVDGELVPAALAHLHSRTDTAHLSQRCWYVRRMGSVAVERQVSASAEAVWALLRDFGNIAWIPVGGRVDVEGAGPGMRRLIHGSGDGPPVVERLVAADDAARSIEYVIDENNPLPVTTYVGRVRIDPDDGGSVIRWSAEFEPAGDAAEAAGVVELMLTTLAGWLGDAACAAP
jgi:hypothetical protein